MSANGCWAHCYTCKEPIWLAPDREEMLRRSHKTFYCLWGHQQYFPKGESEADKLRRERDSLKQQAARLEEEKRMAWNTANDQSERRQAAERRVSAAKGQITRLKNRASNGVCPCCNRSFADLHRHMQTKHKGFVAEPIDLDGATVQ